MSETLTSLRSRLRALESDRNNTTSRKLAAVARAALDALELEENNHSATKELLDEALAALESQ